MTTTTTMTTTDDIRADAVHRRRRTRALGVLGASAGAAALWALAVPLAGIDLRVSMGGHSQAVGLPAVIGVSLAAGLLGWALLAVLESRSPRGVVIWTAAALVVAVLSLAGPLTSAVDPAAGAVLAGLHVLVAAVLIPVLRGSSVGR